MYKDHASLQAFPKGKTAKKLGLKIDSKCVIVREEPFYYGTCGEIGTIHSDTWSENPSLIMENGEVHAIPCSRLARLPEDEPTDKPKTELATSIDDLSEKDVGNVVLVDSNGNRRLLLAVSGIALLPSTFSRLYEASARWWSKEEAIEYGYHIEPLESETITMTLEEAREELEKIKGKKVKIQFEGVTK